MTCSRSSSRCAAEGSVPRMGSVERMRRGSSGGTRAPAARNGLALCPRATLVGPRPRGRRLRGVVREASGAVLTRPSLPIPLVLRPRSLVEGDQGGVARPERFELPTPWFVARYSIQLSYGRVRGRDYRASPAPGRARPDPPAAMPPLGGGIVHGFHARRRSATGGTGRACGGSKVRDAARDS